ncbi:MAG: hypothetical protein J3R72DRAFT_508344, partial [Linnemannia gamsii]
SLDFTLFSLVSSCTPLLLFFPFLFPLSHTFKLISLYYILDSFDLSTLLSALPVMVTAARLNPPPVFTGVRDGFSALAWLVAVNRYFNLAKIKDDERTPHALSYLASPGPARWFDGCGLADTCNFKSEFTPAFKLEYIPNNFAGACRRHLTNLRMTTNFSTYLTTFKELLGALLGYAATEAAQTTVNEFAQTSFIDNCPLVLQQMIEGHLIQNPNTTLVQIFQYAQEMDRIYSFKPDTGPKTNSSVIASAPIISSLTPSSSSSHATAMEVDHIQQLYQQSQQQWPPLPLVSRRSRMVQT